MRHLHLRLRRTPSFGRALAVTLLVAVAQYRELDQNEFEERPGNLEDGEDLLDDLEEAEPLEDEDEDDDWEDDDYWSDEEEAEPLGDDDEPDGLPPIVGDERIW